ncbi:hypothetical protein D3C81_1895470 [compost metagenome]
MSGIADGQPTVIAKIENAPLPSDSADGFIDGLQGADHPAVVGCGAAEFGEK